MPTFFVQPAQPTALSDKYEVELPGYELWATMIHNVHILIHLTNDGVPVEFEERPHESTSSVILDSHVIQSDLSGLLNTLHQRSALDFEVPLLRLKVVSFRDETTLGISWNHTLGLHLIYPPPTFEKPVFPEPSECTIEELRSSIYYLHELCSEEELCKKYSERVHTSERVNWFFERQELETLCNSLRQRSPSAASRLSIHDSLSAYIVTVINRILPKQIRKIKYRFSGASFACPDVAGNAIIEILTALPENPADITGIATSIRETLTYYRQHEIISTWMSVASHMMLVAAKAGKLFYYPPTGIMSVNSMAIIDWCSAHFGQPESHRHHMSGHGLLYLRVFGANPWRGDDGSWHAPEGRIDISIGVPQGCRQKVLDILAQGLNSLKTDG
ncbi:hypothetical protein BDR03DRAFT_1030761 [Suillus americanus]|nr:hypothetical protein BDR03DRAFT_1030761 [Suillus americanus]